MRKINFVAWKEVFRKGFRKRSGYGLNSCFVKLRRALLSSRERSGSKNTLTVSWKQRRNSDVFVDFFFPFHQEPPPPTFTLSPPGSNLFVCLHHKFLISFNLWFQRLKGYMRKDHFFCFPTSSTTCFFFNIPSHIKQHITALQSRYSGEKSNWGLCFLTVQHLCVFLPFRSLLVSTNSSGKCFGLWMINASPSLTASCRFCLSAIRCWALKRRAQALKT